MISSRYCSRRLRVAPWRRGPGRGWRRFKQTQKVSSKENAAIAHEKSFVPTSKEFPLFYLDGTTYGMLLRGSIVALCWDLLLLTRAASIVSLKSETSRIHILRRPSLLLLLYLNQFLLINSFLDMWSGTIWVMSRTRVRVILFSKHHRILVKLLLVMRLMMNWLLTHLSKGTLLRNVPNQKCCIIRRWSAVYGPRVDLGWRQK